MKILVSGFEPFGGMKHNPSEGLVQNLPSDFNGHSLTGVVLPVSFHNAFFTLKNEIEKETPDLVLSFGLAQKRREITPEKIAVNWINASLADNEGFQPREVKVWEEGPDGLFSLLPVERMVEALQKAEIPASLSLSAGSYVCNQLMYQLLLFSEERGFRAGFVHLPEGWEEEVYLKALFSLLEVLA